MLMMLLMQLETTISVKNDLVLLQQSVIIDQQKNNQALNQLYHDLDHNQDCEKRDIDFTLVDGRQYVISLDEHHTILKVIER